MTECATCEKPSKQSCPENQNENEHLINQAIHAHFNHSVGKCYIKFLWEKDGISRYRVNWWDSGESVILKSSFCCVTKSGDDYQVTDQTQYK